MNNGKDFGRQLDQLILEWLEEDVGNGDITSEVTIPPEHKSKGIIHAKQSGVLAGLHVAARVFELVDASLRFEALVEEGDKLEKGTQIAQVYGTSRSLLTGERLALNLLQRMSGVATQTRAFVEKLEGLPVRLADTRKTTPGHRSLEKYAVRVGGGANHRFGLYDAVMIKDNHIKASGGIINAVRASRAAIPHTMKIEVEVESEEQVVEALEAGADIIMLDNMQPALMQQVVQRIRKHSPHVIIEASGGVNLSTVKEIASCGVDVISVGALTNSIQSLDISLDLNEVKGGT